MKKRLLSLFLAITMALTPVFFAGCDIEDEIKDSASNAGQEASKSFVAEFFDGFKVVYSTSMITGETGKKKELNEDLYAALLNKLNAYYGSGSGNLNLNAFFPDSIRQTIYKEDGIAKQDKNNKWLWYLNPELDGLTVDDVFGAVDYNNLQGIKNDMEQSYPQLSTYYATPIQIVLFETMLGYNSKTTFKFDGETATVNVDECPNNTSLNGKDVTSEEVQNYLGRFQEEGKTDCGLKQRYYTTATYSGLTKADADGFITYILNEVIGEDVVAYDYTTFGPEQTTYRETANAGNNNYVKDDFNYYNYRNYVGRVAEMVYSQVYDGTTEFKYTYPNLNIEYDFILHNPTLPPVGSFSPKSVSYLSDYETDAFFESENAFKMFDDDDVGNATSFENSPLAEYQSVTIMLNKEQDFGGMLMEIFSPNPDLAINLYVRCYLYDESTKQGQLFEWKQDDINFYHSTPVSDAYTEISNDEQAYIGDKGYLYKTTEKDNAGRDIVGYFTDFEVAVDLSEVPEKYQNKSEDKAVDDIQIDTINLTPFNNFDEKNGVKMKAEGNAVGKSRVEASLDNGNYAYKVVESKNGFGGVTVLDETKAECSFYEVVFDIKKDPNLPNQNYDFKLAIVTPV